MSQRNKTSATIEAGLLIGIFPLVVGVLAVSQVACLGQEALDLNATRAQEDIPRIQVQPPIDDAFVQAELGRIGGRMVERGQVLPRTELLKSRLRLPLALPVPSTVPCEAADLVARCREAVVVVARLTRLGESNAWVALPATGFFISSSGAFVTSSHVIHNPDYEGMVVLTGDGRVLPVRALLADDEACDVAILKAEGGPVSALPLEALADAGSRVAVMSHPVGRFFTFTQGSVTRRSVQYRGAHMQELLEISADFGPGSSGAPVVNSRGNVVGWVDTLRVWPADSNRDTVRSPTLTFRECGVTSDLRRLVQLVEVGVWQGDPVTERAQGSLHAREAEMSR